MNNQNITSATATTITPSTSTTTSTTSTTSEVESLASKCIQIIATNLERYPITSFHCISEIEWDSIIECKYKMTSPKLKYNNNHNNNHHKNHHNLLLSDGRKFPLIPYKQILNIEMENIHLSKSKVSDVFIWKDNVNFKFKIGNTTGNTNSNNSNSIGSSNSSNSISGGSTSRPLLLMEPWDEMIKKMNIIVQVDIPFWIDCFNNNNNNNNNNNTSSSKNECTKGDNNNDDDNYLVGLRSRSSNQSISSSFTTSSSLSSSTTTSTAISSLSSSSSSSSIIKPSFTTTATTTTTSYTKKPKSIPSIIHILQNTPMIVPLLLASGIGKAIKKLIKVLHTNSSSNNDTSNSGGNSGCSSNDTKKKWIFQLEEILQNWKIMASVNGVSMSSSSSSSKTNNNNNNQNKDKEHEYKMNIFNKVTGKSRHTSNEQHEQDIANIQKCHEWRDLYRVLLEREQQFMQLHGSKMRKIRENLEVNRPKIGTAVTKKFGKRMVLKDDGGIECIGLNGGSRSSTNGSTMPMRKLGKLRQEFQQRNAVIKGGKAGIASTSMQSGTKRSFGSSVSAVLGTAKKRNTASSVNGCTKAGRREILLNDGKKMKLPKLDSQYKRSFK